VNYEGSEGVKLMPRLEACALAIYETFIGIGNSWDAVLFIKGALRLRFSIRFLVPPAIYLGARLLNG
jgi:hypothetical protein